MKKCDLIFFVLFTSINLFSQKQTVEVRLYPVQAKDTISRHIYGHFAEHLVRCIYGGLQVGENSNTQNTNGYGTDVLGALRKNFKSPIFVGREDTLPMNIIG